MTYLLRESLSAWQCFLNDGAAFSCTERIVEAAVSDSPPDLPITDMQSGFPQLFCSTGLGFSFTHCIRWQENKRVSVYCRHQREFRFKLPLGFSHPQPESHLPQRPLCPSTAIFPWNTVLFSMKYLALRDTFAAITPRCVYIWPTSNCMLIKVESEHLCADDWWIRLCHSKTVPKVSNQPIVPKPYSNSLALHCVWHVLFFPDIPFKALNHMSFKPYVLITLLPFEILCPFFHII